MNGKVISGPAAILVLFLFFMPWVAVSCDGLPQTELSGFQLAVGSEVEGYPIFLLIPVMALVSLFLLLSTLWKPSLETKANWGVAAASGVGLVVLLGKWLQLRGDSSGSLTVSILPSLWVSVVALIGIGLGAVFDLLRPAIASRQKSQATQSQRSPMYKSANETWVDEGFRPADSHATMVDDGSYQVDPHRTMVDDGSSPVDANYTVVDDGGAGTPNVTIVDDGSPVDKGANRTIVDDGSSEESETNRTFISDKTAIGYTALSLTLPEAEEVEEEDEDEDEDEDEEAVIGATMIASTPPAPVERTEVLNIPPKPVGWLVIATGEREGETFELGEDTTLGRDPESDIFINDTALSALHMRVKLVNGRFIAIDQNSTNGLYVFDPQQNGWEKEEEVVLQEGTQLRLGRTDLHFTTLHK